MVWKVVAAVAIVLAAIFHLHVRSLKQALNDTRSQLKECVDGQFLTQEPIKIAEAQNKLWAKHRFDDSM